MFGTIALPARIEITREPVAWVQTAVVLRAADARLYTEYVEAVLGMCERFWSSTTSLFKRCSTMVRVSSAWGGVAMTKVKPRYAFSVVEAA